MGSELKMIGYHFQRAKPNQARRVPSLALGQATVIDYATLEGLSNPAYTLTFSLFCVKIIILYFFQEGFAKILFLFSTDANSTKL